MTRKNYIIMLAVFSLLVILCAPLIGGIRISFESIIGNISDTTDNYIFWKIRVPRVLTTFLAGMALSISGMTFQAMFRNPLATPFTLGVSSGAAFGAALYVWAGFSFHILGISGITLSSFLGSLLTIFIVYGITKVKKGFSTATMLLAGVAISFFFSSLILFIQYMSDFTQSFTIVRWLMGGFEVVGYDSMRNMAPFALIGILTILLFSNELTLVAAGEDIAASRGVNVDFTKKALFFAASLMIGGVVSICGPIGFVGMMCPHICRLVIGNNHKYLAPASLLFGGAFLTICDALARTLIAPAEIPVGIITSMIGGPFFLWLLLGGSSEKSFIKH